MQYLVDSDWIINFLNRQESYRSLLESFRKDGLGVSSVSIAEVAAGIAGEDNEREKFSGLNDFLEPLVELPFDRRVAFMFAQIRKDLLRRHLPLENFDIAIAATALEYNLTLVTDNVRHYGRIEGLKIYRRDRKD